MTGIWPRPGLGGSEHLDLVVLHGPPDLATVLRGHADGFSLRENRFRELMISLRDGRRFAAGLDAAYVLSPGELDHAYVEWARAQPRSPLELEPDAAVAERMRERIEDPEAPVASRLRRLPR